MKYDNGIIAILTLAGALALPGCSESSDSGAPEAATTPGSVGVTQAGAQDFGLFRQILEDGGIPGPDTLDDLGFFAEHKLDYPEATCGQDICMHGLLGVMGNMISGSTCTLVQIGLNSPLDPETIVRPPLHLVIAVDVSGSMVGEPIESLREGLVQMIPHLEPTDRVSLVTYSDEAQVVFEAVPADQTQILADAFTGLALGGSTNLYDGLFTAFQIADAHQDPAWQNRVVFLSDGMATSGLLNPAKLTSLAEGYARQGIGLTTIGVGKDFNVDAMRDLGEVGAGNFYFLEDPRSVREVFTDEVKTFLVPLALDARIDVEVGGGYSIRRAYGTNGWEGGAAGGVVAIPSLFFAGRTSSEDPIDEGRRGGGGAILLELVANQDQSGIQDPLEVGGLALSWTHPVTGEVHEEQALIQAPHAPDAPPAQGYFTDDTVEKGFVMLNLFAGFQLATQLAADSDPRMARRTLEAMRPNVAGWLAQNPDPDITDDLRYVDLFIQNLLVAEASTKFQQPSDPPEVVNPPNPWPYD